MRLERWPEALDAMKKTLPEMQHDAGVGNAIGMIHYRMGQFKAAAEAFKQAVELAPDQKEIRFNLALAELGIRNRPGAISQYKMLSETDPALAKQLYNIIFADKLVFAPDK
jgi:tetratricopeptide (TPR) repeat protein